MVIYSGNTDPARLAYMRLMAGSQTADAEAIKTYRDYYSGEHPTALTQRQREFLNVASGEAFCENYCAMIVDTLAERLNVTGFATGDDAVDAILWTWWQKNRMDAQQGDLHTYAARDGVSFVIVEWDNEEGRPALFVNEAWDGTEGVKVHWRGRSRTRKDMLFASKRWRVEFDNDGNVDTFRRLNLYYPDRIEKYRTGADNSDAGWVRYADEDGGAWPVRWIDTDGGPLGIPVIPFLNKRIGVSELSVAVPIQAAVNKTLIDIIAAADVEGFGIYTKTGGTYVDAVSVFPGAFWQDTDPTAVYGKLAGSNMAGLLETRHALVQALAVVTRRPVSYFTGVSDASSGESLKQREAGIVSQAKAATVHFGNAWEDVMQMAARLDRVFGAEQIPDGLTVSCQWADVETRNDETLTRSVIDKKDAGIIDQEQSWIELGYSEEAKQAMRRRAQDKQAQAIALAVKLAAQQTDQVDQTDRPEGEDEDDDASED